MPTIHLCFLPSPHRFFDRAGCGYIKGEDLRRLLNLLGLSLTYRTVKELMYTALDASARATSAAGRNSHPDRFYYRDLTDVEVPQPVKKAAVGAEEAVVAVAVGEGGAADPGAAEMAVDVAEVDGEVAAAGNEAAAPEAGVVVAQELAAADDAQPVEVTEAV